MRRDISRCGETKRITEEDLAAAREDKEDEIYIYIYGGRQGGRQSAKEKASLKKREQRAAEVHKLQQRKKRTRSVRIIPILFLFRFFFRGETIVFIRTSLEILWFVQRLGFADYNLASDLVSRMAGCKPRWLTRCFTRRGKITLGKQLKNNFGFLL